MHKFQNIAHILGPKIQFGHFWRGICISFSMKYPKHEIRAFSYNSFYFNRFLYFFSDRLGGHNYEFISFSESLWLGNNAPFIRRFPKAFISWVKRPLILSTVSSKLFLFYWRSGNCLRREWEKLRGISLKIEGASFNSRRLFEWNTCSCQFSKR